MTIEPTGLEIDDPEVHMLRNGGREGLSRDASAIVTGMNSGHQVINIVALAGARRIVLLGYDGKHGSGGRRHWFGDHPDRTPFPQELANNVKHYRTLVEPLRELGVAVVNASPDTAVDAFPRATLEAALA